MNFSRLVAVCASYCVFSTSVFADTGNSLAFNLASEVGYIDNFLYQSNNEQSTAFYTLASDVTLSSKSQQSAFDLEANLAAHFFEQFKDDNHTDLTITPKYQFKFSENQRLHVSALWLNSYIYRGTGLSLGEAETLMKGDEKENLGANIGYQYGTRESQGRLNFEVNYHESEFTSRRNETHRLDTEITNVKSNFDYLLSGKTFLAFDIGYKKIQYPNNPIISRDSFTGLVGVKWYSTVISELNFLVGYQQLKFEDKQLTDDHAFKWRVDYIWRPSDFSKVHIRSNRNFDESYRLVSSYRLAQTHQIDIEHEFTEYWRVLATVGINNEKFISPEDIQTEDYLFSKVSVAYQYNERLLIQLSYHYQSLEAKADNINYLHNRLGLSVKVNI